MTASFASVCSLHLAFIHLSFPRWLCAYGGVRVHISKSESSTANAKNSLCARFSHAADDFGRFLFFFCVLVSRFPVNGEKVFSFVFRAQLVCPVYVVRCGLSLSPQAGVVAVSRQEESGAEMVTALIDARRLNVERHSVSLCKNGNTLARSLGNRLQITLVIYERIFPRKMWNTLLFPYIPCQLQLLCRAEL